MEGTETTRTHSRFGVRWDATCRPARGGWEQGTILDASPYGIFVAADPHRATIGDRIRLRCAPGSAAQALGRASVVDVEGIVRWVGYSARHGCHGIGIKLLRRSVDVAIHLTPEIVSASPLSSATRRLPR